MKFETDTYRQGIPNQPTNAVTAFLQWLCLWFDVMWRPDDFNEDEPWESKPSYQLSRVSRRSKGRPIPPGRDMRPFRCLTGRVLTRRQFLEYLCHVSLWGRVRIYHICQFGRWMRRRFSAGQLSYALLALGLWSEPLWPT